MKKKITGLTLSALLLALWLPAQAQQPKIYRIAVITAGGAWYATIDGLRVGLRELGLEEGKQFVLAIRDTKGDVKAAEEAARNLEQEKVNLIYTTQTSVTIAARRATADIPIVFCAGADPVVLGLVDSFARPGGRLTGVYEPGTDLTAKRLEILKEIIPEAPPGSDILQPQQSCSHGVLQVGAGDCATHGNTACRTARRFRRGTSGRYGSA